MKEPIYIDLPSTEPASITGKVEAHRKRTLVYEVTEIAGLIKEIEGIPPIGAAMWGAFLFCLCADTAEGTTIRQDGLLRWLEWWVNNYPDFDHDMMLASEFLEDVYSRGGTEIVCSPNEQTPAQE